MMVKLIAYQSHPSIPTTKFNIILMIAPASRFHLEVESEITYFANKKTPPQMRWLHHFRYSTKVDLLKSRNSD